MGLSEPETFAPPRAALMVEKTSSSSKLTNANFKAGSPRRSSSMFLSTTACRFPDSQCSKTRPVNHAALSGSVATFQRLALPLGSFAHTAPHSPHAAHNPHVGQITAGAAPFNPKFSRARAFIPVGKGAPLDITAMSSPTRSHKTHTDHGFPVKSPSVVQSVPVHQSAPAKLLGCYLNTLRNKPKREFPSFDERAPSMGTGTSFFRGESFTGFCLSCVENISSNPALRVGFARDAELVWRRI